MTDFLLAKPVLPKDHIDCSVGEAHVVLQNLLDIFKLTPYLMPCLDKMFEYQEPQGYQPLVKLLEDKYQAPVVITNGAKNALGAICFALKQMGKTTVSLPNPYWALLPPLIEMHGLQWKPTYKGCDAHLLVQPNNPNGQMRDIRYLKALEIELKKTNEPLVHDAVYFSHIYLPTEYPLQKIGDVQIYSASKAYGLSGIRLGYAVCYNKDFYKLISSYMETMTVGVSTLSQVFLYDLLTTMQSNPALTHQFESQSAAALTASKKILKQVSPAILEVPNNMEDIPGMFAFVKCHKPEAFAQAKVNPAWGEHFGAPGYVRMNLAFPENQMQDIVNRLNSVVV